MKKSTKLLTVLLAVVMLISVLASCGGNGGNETTASPSTKKPGTTTAPGTTVSPSTAPDATQPDETQPDATQPDETTPDETEPDETTKLEDLTTLLPPDIDLGIDMNIFAGTLYYDEWLDTNDGDIVGTELYNRVLRVEKNLGINLTVERIPGDSTQKDTIMSEIRKRQESTDPNMIADLCSTYSQFAGNLTLEGRYQNIANSDMIDLEKPWWPKDLLINSTIDDKIYFVSGDISPTLIYETYAIFFNIDLVEKYNIENPISLVLNRQWTIDKLIEVTENIYEDLDTSKAGPSAGDFLAFNFNDNMHIKALPFGMGVRVIVPDDDDGYVWSEDYVGEKMEIIAGKVSDWINNNPGVTTSNDFSNYGVSFVNEQCIFNLGNFAYAAQNLAGSGIDYGVVPAPLYNTDQEEYYSYYGNPTSFWGIPTNADLDNSALLLESLAADAYVFISPALFERALKLKYVTGEVDGLSKMFDIIRDGLVFDASMFYFQHISGYSSFTELAGDIKSWQSMYVGMTLKSMKKSLESKVVSILRKLN